MLAVGKIPMSTNDLSGGGSLLFAGLFGLFYLRKWPQKIQGLTVRQYKWCCAVVIVCGAVITVWGFFD